MLAKAREIEEARRLEEEARKKAEEEKRRKVPQPCLRSLAECRGGGGGGFSRVTCFPSGLATSLSIGKKNTRLDTGANFPVHSAYGHWKSIHWEVTIIYMLVSLQEQEEKRRREEEEAR